MATSFERMKAKRVARGEPALLPRTNEQRTATALRNASLGFGKISAPVNSPTSTYTSNTKPNTITFENINSIKPRLPGPSVPDNSTFGKLTSDRIYDAFGNYRDASGTLVHDPAYNTDGTLKVQRPVTPAPVSNTGITAPTAQTDAERALFIKLQKGETLNDADYGTLYDIQKKRQTEGVDAQRAAYDAIIAKQTEQRKAEEERVKAREQELRQTTEGRVQLYKEAQEAQGALEKQRAERTANENLATSERLLGARGNLTSAVGYQNARDLENERAATLNSIDSRVAAQVALYQAQLQGADDETLKEMNKRVNELYDVEQEAILTAETNLQNLKLTAQQQGDTDLMALVAQQQENLTKKKTETNYNEDVTLLRNDGFLYGENGQRLKDAEGNDMTYDQQNGTIMAGTKMYRVGANGLELVSDTEVVTPSDSETSNQVQLTTAQKTKLDSAVQVVDQLKAYRDLYNQKVGGSGVNLTGADAAELRGASANLMFAVAQAVGTGALQAADRAVIERSIPDPTSLTSSAGTLLRGGKEGGLSALDNLISTFENKVNYYTGTTNSQRATGNDELTSAYNEYIDSGATPEEALSLTQDEFQRSWQPTFNTPVSAGSTNSGTASKPLVIANSPVDPKTKHDAECVVYSRMFAPNLPRIAWSDTSKAKNAEYKRKVINTTTPEVGAVAIMPTVGFYGHTANVIAKNPDGTITIQEANYKDGKVTRRTGTPEELKIEGYFYDGVTKPIA